MVELGSLLELKIGNDDKTMKADPHQPSVKVKAEIPGADVHRILTEDERTKLDKLQNYFIKSVVNKEERIDIDLTELCGLVNFSMLNVKNYIRFIKSIDEFRDMVVDMQTASLKAQMLKCLILLASYLYDASSKAFHSLGQHVSEDTVKQGFDPHVDVAEIFLQFCRESQDEFSKELVIQAALQVVLVFSPDGDNLVNHRHLSNIQDEYLHLLKHYIESKYSFKAGLKIYASLLQKLKQLKIVSSKMLEVLHQMDTEKVQPLMLEVLNF